MNAAATRPPRMGWTYCIRDDASQAVKIGFSRDPERRLRQLQTANPNRLRLVSAMFSTDEFERMMHRSFAVHAKGGEWFDDSEGQVSALMARAAEGAR